MNYINMKYLASQEVKLSTLTLLQLIHQNKTEDLGEILSQGMTEQMVEELKSKDYITEVKGKKTDNMYSKLRLGKKGKLILENSGIPELLEEDIKVFEWLKNLYIDSGKEVGNAKKTKSHIANFRVESGLAKNRLLTVCKHFIESEENFEYSQRLEYLFFKPSSVFQTRFELDQSRLYQYYLKHEGMFKAYFAQEPDKYPE